MRALLSVSDKNQIVEFAQGLQSQGWDIISTGVHTRSLTKQGLKS